MELAKAASQSCNPWAEFRAGLYDTTIRFGTRGEVPDLLLTESNNGYTPNDLACRKPESIHSYNIGLVTYQFTPHYRSSKEIQQR